jgi:hypothetical protein
MRRTGFLAVTALALATIVPAYAAERPKPVSPPTTAAETTPTLSTPTTTTTAPMSCAPHPVAYEVWGTLASAGSLTKHADGTYGGTLSVHVTRTNEHATADKGATKSYTFARAHVSFGSHVSRSTPADGSRAYLQGTITTEPKTCTSFTPTLSIAKVELHTPQK